MINRMIMVFLLSNGIIFGMEDAMQLQQDLAAYRKNVRDMLHAVENNNVLPSLICNDYCNLNRPIFNYNDTKGKFWGKVTPLILATFYDREKMVEFLLLKKVRLSLTGENGDTALHIAARTGRDNLVKLLLVAGADVSKLNDEGETALQAAQSSLLYKIAVNYRLQFTTIIDLLLVAEEKIPHYL